MKRNVDSILIGAALFLLEIRVSLGNSDFLVRCQNFQYVISIISCDYLHANLLIIDTYCTSKLPFHNYLILMQTSLYSYKVYKFCKIMPKCSNLKYLGNDDESLHKLLNKICLRWYKINNGGKQVLLLVNEPQIKDKPFDHIP